MPKFKMDKTLIQDLQGEITGLGKKEVEERFGTSFRNKTLVVTFESGNVHFGRYREAREIPDDQGGGWQIYICTNPEEKKRVGVWAFLHQVEVARKVSLVGAR